MKLASQYPDSAGEDEMVGSPRVPFPTDDRGAALMEFAMVLPFLFLLFFASLEVVRALEAKNSLAMFAREAANLAFIECLERDVKLPNGNPTGFIDVCLNARVPEMMGVASALVPGMKLSVQVFLKEGNNLVRYGNYNSGGLGSRYSVSGGPGMAPLMIADSDGFVPIVVAEASYDFVPLVYLPLAVNLYEVAIY